jgi:hypothetical protein
MKEIIRKFEKDSGLEIYGLGMDRVKWQAALEKFAELIVQECLLALEPDPMAPAINYDVEQKFYQRSADKIKKHFGVEE